MLSLLLIAGLVLAVAAGLYFVFGVEAAIDPRSVDTWEPEAVIIEAGEAIDLHSFAPRDVVSAARSAVDQAAEEGRPRLRLIHGRGRGVQRAAVRQMLAAHPAVESFADAPGQLGGWGATIALIKTSERSASI